MKIVWVILGLAGFAYAGFGINQFVDIYSQSDPGSAGGGSRIAAGLLPVLVGVIVCLVGFKKRSRNRRHRKRLRIPQSKIRLPRPRPAA